MATTDRDTIKTYYKVFYPFVLRDSRSYYESTIKKYRKASSQVSRLSLICLVVACVSGLLLLGLIDTDTKILNGSVDIAVLLVLLMALSSVLALGFTILKDIYQWDRYAPIYETSLENLEVADAQSPVEEMDDLTYLAAFRAMAEGTMSVMADETAQWGAAVRNPVSLERFISEQMERSARMGSYSDVDGGAPPSQG